MNEAFSELLFFAHPEPLWIYDLESLRFLEVNDAAIRRYGYSRAEFLSMTIKDIRPAEDVAALLENVDAVTSGLDEAGVWCHQIKSGELLQVEITSHTIEYRDRRAELVLARDVSDRVDQRVERHARDLKTANRRLLEQEANLRTAERLLGLGTWKLDLRANRLSWSNNLYAMYGVSPGDFGHRFEDYVALVHPDDRDAMVGNYQAFEAEAQPYFRFEHRIRRPDGTVIHVRGIGERTQVAGEAMITGVVRDVTEELEINRRLAEANRLLTIANRTARLGGWRVNLDTSAVHWSGETAAIHELPEGSQPGLDEAIGFYAPEDRPRIVGVFAACANDGIPFDEVLRLVTARGNRIWIRAIGEPERDAHDRIIGVQGAFQDITELIEARERTEELSRRLLDTLEHISDGFFMLDRQWRFTFLNKRAEQLLAHPRAELLGSSIWEKFPETLDTTSQTEYEATMQDGRTSRFVQHYPSLNAWVRVTAYPVSDGIAVHFNDITAERERENQLRLLEAAVSRLNDIVMITEAAPIDAPNGPKILYVNDAFVRRTGYSREEVIGKTPRLLQGPDTDRAALDRIRTALETKQAIREELINVTREGRAIWLEIDIAPIIDAYGVPTHFVAVERDVTERHELDERLRQSQKLEAVGQLTGGLAHDFNNLLTVILGNAELLQLKLAGDERLGRLARMTAAAAQRGAELTHRMLAFSRRQALAPRRVEPGKLLGGMEDLLRRTLSGDIDIELICADTTWPIEVDPGQLEMAILNLAINARDAMPGGGALTIEVSNAWLDENYANEHDEVVAGPYTLLSVSDTGTGMSMDVLRKAVEPFFTTKDVGKGTGLGLSMVYGFVKQSGGHFKLYSEPGRGTTVKMYFRRSAVDDVEATAAQPAQELAGGHEHVLVVEDNAMVRSHVIEQLQSLGYQVSSAENGPDALMVLDRAPDMDLLFTDVVMPGSMDGRELVDAARTIRPDLKVLFTSGYTQNAIVHQGRLDPGIQLLSKPYRLQELAAAVRGALDRPADSVG